MQEHKPLYLYSREEALRHGERDQWRDSYRENCDCARAIERAIAENYRDNCLGNCAGSILDRYGFTRVNWVLANTMQQKSYDGRFSEGNKRWAKQFYIPNDDIRWHFTVESHPGLTNLFVEQVRDAWQSLGLFDASHCLPDDSDQDYTGKVVVIDPNILKDKYKALGCQSSKYRLQDQCGRCNEKARVAPCFFAVQDQEGSRSSRKSHLRRRRNRPHPGT